MFDWMVWTLPTAVFFICVLLMLIGMTVWEIASPSVLRKGWLPIATTRGDRLFITLLGSAFIHLAWLFFAGPDLLWAASLLCLVYAAAVFRWV